MARKIIFAVLLGVLAIPALAGAPKLSEPRQAELIHRLKHDCGSCHGMTMKGGLGPALLPVNLADKPDDYLVQVILDGSPGTPMPPWRSELSPQEAAWLVEILREGTAR